MITLSQFVEEHSMSILNHISIKINLMVCIFRVKTGLAQDSKPKAILIVIMGIKLLVPDWIKRPVT